MARSKKQTAMRASKGFSLIEVLLALAIGGLLLTSASSLLVTIAQAWANRPATRDAFDAHANGVAHFLGAILEEATLHERTPAGKQAIWLDKPVDFSDLDDPLIRFYLREAPPLFFWPHGPASRVHVYLLADDQDGLNLLWYSDLQELEKNDKGERAPEEAEDMFLTPVSKFCHKIYYCYYGDEDSRTDDIQKEWEIKDDLEEDLRTGKFRLPDFIQVVLRWDEEDLERMITLPIARPAPSGIEEEPK